MMKSSSASPKASGLSADKPSICPYRRAIKMDPPTSRVGSAGPDLAVAVGQIVGLYVRCHYVAHHTKADGERLAQRVTAFRPKANRNRPGHPV
ncbi:hypothetical protein [uncultured Thiodictyon sp.]|uniref:hypothetical protein n=1 Tax=uncultured Thiodictyon sp. TaxID=1846217 RepID=UPI0025CC0B28|nr:hypothetical protein [uncultured Thiodictyon sp.]